MILRVPQTHRALTSSVALLSTFNTTIILFVVCIYSTTYYLVHIYIQRLRYEYCRTRWLTYIILFYINRTVILFGFFFCCTYARNGTFVLYLVLWWAPILYIGSFVIIMQRNYLTNNGSSCILKYYISYLLYIRIISLAVPPIHCGKLPKAKKNPINLETSFDHWKKKSLRVYTLQTLMFYREIICRRRMSL